MRKILIVDDENNIRLGLKAMITREFPTAYEFQFAGDGEEALRALRHTLVDIVITDIRMPVMDGIALINWIQDMNPKPAVVILSGHDDFQYAKEAIRCEVKEYLLKPIVRDELSRTLLRLENEMKLKEHMTEQLTSSLQQRDAFQESQLSYVLRHPHLQENEVQHKLSRIDMDWLVEGFQLGMLQYRGSVERMSHGELLDRIQAEVGNVPERFRKRFAYVFDKENQLVLIAEHGELFQYLADRITGTNYFTYSLGLSEYKRGMTHLQEAYVEAKQALKYTFLQSVLGVIRYENIRHRSLEFIVPIETIKKIANMLGANRDKEMIALLQEVLDMKTVARYDIAYLEAISKAFNELVFDKIFHVYGGESVEILRLFKMVGDISNFNYFHDYFHSVEGLLNRLNDYVRSMKTFHIDHKEMKKAVQYMHENYQKDLNMTIVSNHVSLNYSYFSQAFKEYTGNSFVNYLKKLRIDKAQELLATTEYKVYEIGEIAGFENTKHFSRVFKENVGVSPQEYRDQREVINGLN
ncbi:response regulator [Paenibacillus sp. SYP-B3998]|uniref:Response regulator n=1 Tax=Paenibacillus sp. SYP-B3998 TaxID=2678564 RepID=A0A6G4A4F8_9BACL|nr:response regulator [Paenibacillus sp. SYP-B3998]NEW09353.1 response regulator [Paenibacillus sp. SYP-B3998]